ncbi:S9 family peptidase [Ideonella sp.]|uniref:S9 family peptidase n=1 Tax=Ideonella sp. TaxID=1929293 RepID=UPI003BB79406
MPRSAAKAKPTGRAITIEDLWRLERLGAPSMSPDGAQVVASLSSPSLDDNRSRSAIWLLSTLGGDPRCLTRCGDKDGQPKFSPQGDLVAFVAQREQEGRKDDTPQLYLIAPDGGEARRAAEVATGIEAFQWFPDGRRIAFISWVWPGLKGAKAQAKQMKAQKARKATGVVSSEACYRYWDHFLPMGRVPHLHVLEVATGKVTDLFEGTPYELSRFEPDAHCFDISPDGRHVAFAFDPAAEKRIDGRFALVELNLGKRRFTERARDDGWDFTAPRYSPDGRQLAFLASHQAQKHTEPTQLALTERGGEGWRLLSATWDHAPEAPLLWEDDGSALLCCADQQGRKPLWRFDIEDQRAEVLVAGGTVAGFDKRAGTLVSLVDSADHPAQLFVHPPAEAARRIERFNDAVLAPLELGRTESVWLTGALGDPVQMWLHYPPGFNPKKKYPLLHTLHGGPHTGPGDNWHYRWNCKLFAAQGCVVASVNYHGSTGYGQAFLDSITHRWGELELQDIEAATDWLLAQPWVDPRQVFASGGSYGGYLVAWMNGHVPAGRYAAYVCHAGCYDWCAMFADDAWSWHAKELGAWYWDDLAKVNSQSPHAFAAQFSTPTLVTHGALDYRVPDQQGLAYYNTLKAKGVDARLLWFPDENHWVLKPQNSQLWYEEFFAWLQRFKPPGR